MTQLGFNIIVRTAHDASRLVREIQYERPECDPTFWDPQPDDENAPNCFYGAIPLLTNPRSAMIGDTILPIEFYTTFHTDPATS